MSINAFGLLLTHKNPRFICRSLIGPSKKMEVKISHEIGSALDDFFVNEILDDRLDDSDQLKGFIKNISSVRLYCDVNSDACAFYIAHPEEWADLQSELDDWFDDLTDQERNECIPSWYNNSFVFAEIPNSSTYFLYRIDEVEKGKIYEFTGDGTRFEEVSVNFDTFLDYLCRMSDELISDIQCYTRFCDGVSDIQWLPETYLYDSDGK